MNVNTIVETMPYGYRWATADEVEEFLNSDRRWGKMREEYWVQVRVGGTDDEPWTDLAIQWDCMIEFGLDHDHDAVECERLMAMMNDPMDGYDDFYNRELEEDMLGRPLFPNEY